MEAFLDLPGEDFFDEVEDFLVEVVDFLDLPPLDFLDEVDDFL